MLSIAKSVAECYVYQGSWDLNKSFKPQCFESTSKTFSIIFISYLVPVAATSKQLGCERSVCRARTQIHKCSKKKLNSRSIIAAVVLGVFSRRGKWVQPAFCSTVACQIIRF
jgi:hypothetical protein